MSLTEKKEALLEDLKDQLAVIAAGHDAKDLGEEFEQAARDFQAIACCNLLLKADREGFQKHLIWCGLTQRAFLDCSRRQGNVGDFHLARSRWPSLFCAITGADDALVAEIHTLAPSDWTPDGEYEEDFAYHFFVSLVATGADAQVREAAVARFERALDGSVSPRLSVCRAIQANDARAFAEAMPLLVEAHSERMKEEEAVTSDDDVAFEPLSHIFTEGLALVRLGVQLGLIQPTDYPMCPSLGWLKPLRVRPDDIFAEIEQTMGRKP